MALAMHLSSDKYDEEPGNGHHSVVHVGMSIYYFTPRLSAAGGMGCTVSLRMPHSLEHIKHRSSEDLRVSNLKNKSCSVMTRP